MTENEIHELIHDCSDCEEPHANDDLNIRLMPSIHTEIKRLVNDMQKRVMRSDLQMNMDERREFFQRLKESSFWF